MATLEEITAEVTAEVEARKPINSQTADAASGTVEVKELTEKQYEQLITDMSADRYEEQQNGYKQARKSAYGSVEDQLDMQYWDAVNETTTWKDHITQVKDDNPKPS
tara:strand:+ start:373 stop:693 length:321 start_codon:yes stop_codon:yes gene_type:complete